MTLRPSVRRMIRARARALLSGIGKSRESSYSRDYDELYEVLRHDRAHGSIVWVLGPAVAFDYDARRAMAGLVQNGYVSALFAGNALATHDLEAGLFNTGPRAGHLHKRSSAITAITTIWRL